MRQATLPPHRLWTSIGTQPTDYNGGVVRLQEAPDLLIWTKTCPAQEFVDQVTDILDAFLIMAYHYAEFATPNQRDLQELIVLVEEAVEDTKNCDPLWPYRLAFRLNRNVHFTCQGAGWCLKMTSKKLKLL